MLRLCFLERRRSLPPNRQGETVGPGKKRTFSDICHTVNQLHKQIVNSCSVPATILSAGKYQEIEIEENTYLNEPLSNLGRR